MSIYFFGLELPADLVSGEDGEAQKTQKTTEVREERETTEDTKDEHRGIWRRKDNHKGTKAQRKEIKKPQKTQKNTEVREEKREDVGGAGGAEVIHIPLIRIEMMEIDTDALEEGMAGSDILIVTSKNAIRALDNDAEAAELFKRHAAGMRRYVTGPVTAKYFSEWSGLDIDGGIGRDAVEITGQLNEIRERQKIFHPAAAAVLPRIRDYCRSRNWEYGHFPAYHTRRVKSKKLLELFGNRSEDILIFSSPSTVESFIDSAGIDDMGSLRGRCLAYGRSTRERLMRYGAVGVEVVAPG